MQFFQLLLAVWTCWPHLNRRVLKEPILQKPEKIESMGLWWKQCCLAAFFRASSDLFLFFFQVKRNVYDLTSIPVRHQLWEGWPSSATDDSVSSLLFISFLPKNGWFYMDFWLQSLSGIYCLICSTLTLHTWEFCCGRCKCTNAQDLDDWSSGRWFLGVRFSACFTQKGNILDWSKAVQWFGSWSLLSDWASGKKPWFLCMLWVHI